MSGDGLNIALSGLVAFQRAISTTSNNIANVDTPGYSRQSIEFRPRGVGGNGSGSQGAGVEVAGLRREHDAFLVGEVQLRSSENEAARIRNELADRVTELIGDPDAGLPPAFDGILPAFEAAATNPASIADRNGFLITLRQATARLGTFSDTLSSLRNELYGRIDTTLSDVNALSSRIADLNLSIVATDGDASALRDTRDTLVNELSELVRVTTIESDDGALSVFMGGVQALVVGGEASTLARTDSQPLQISVLRRGASSDVSFAITGGRLGGLVDGLQDEVETAQAGLDRLALGLVDALNEVHQRGLDLDGNAGGPLLTPLGSSVLQGDRVQPRNQNAGDAVLSISIDDVGQLPLEPLQLSFDGSAWSLFDGRGALVDSFSGLPRSVSALGFTLDLEAGAPASGDGFELRPAAGAARGVGVLVEDPRRVALASPVDGAAALSNGGSVAIGDLTLDALEAGVSATDLPAPITLTYDAASEAFAVSAPPGGTLAYAPASDSGSRSALTVPGYGTLGFVLEGSPADGDVITLTSRPVGAGDSRNARQLVGALEAGRLEGGTLAVADAPSRLLGELAASARGHAFDLGATSTLLARAEAARDSVSGVNLDEEAANLLRFQQAYEANARVVAVSGELFRTLLSAVGG